MIVDKSLQNHLENAQTIEGASIVSAEWNMNLPLNIYKIGNYRYRPSDNYLLPVAQRSKYAAIQSSFDPNDVGNFYTNATDADVVIDGGVTFEGNQDVPLTFMSKKDKEKLLFSLEDCFGRFRPRSGINKLRYFENNFTHYSHPEMTKRPRYYIADKNDKFKYWSSFRTESGAERGIANKKINSMYYIDDTAPFIIYNEEVPANRIIIKIQTHTGNIDLGPFRSATSSFDDPFFGTSNMSVPKRWRVQTLVNNAWSDIVAFNEYSAREDGSPIFGPDGYLQLNYGLKIPAQYKKIFKYSGELTSQDFLPIIENNGQAYLVATNNLSGTYFIWNNGQWESFIAEYGWYVADEGFTQEVSLVNELVSPQPYFNAASGRNEYREFDNISGLRIVVESMNKKDSTFDLIELSPRLCANLSNMLIDFSIKKPASDLGISGMPVGQLLAGTGSLVLFDSKSAFNFNNENSIIAKYLLQNTQFKFYEVVKNVPVYDDLNNFIDNYHYYIPIKTMYSEGFPSTSDNFREVSIELRDFFFYFESLTAPEILLTNVSLSYAISVLLDNIGFSNYVFKKVANEDEQIIPLFFIPPETTVAQVLVNLALATQSAMFFDEYNNFIVMSKNYIMPNETDREIDTTIYGNYESFTPSVIEIASQNNDVYNDGTITYKSRYIQRSYGEISESLYNLSDKTWEYKPVLLWEAPSTPIIRPQNGENSSQSNGYTLSAVPLNSSLTNQLPYVENGIIKNNTIDFGGGVYWINKYQGYFYANGEIIKYDAVEYAIPGLSVEDSINGSSVWISSPEEYEKYFAQVPFNGKIYPTGRVRIYAEPFYEEIEGIVKLKNGPVSKHGRCQFGTGEKDSFGNIVPVVHTAGLNPYWADTNNVRGCQMESSYLFGTTPKFEGTFTTAIKGNSASDLAIARRSFRNGIVKNFLSNSYLTEAEIGRKYVTDSATVQSSAFVMTGGSFYNTEKPIDHLSYVYKTMNNSYKHFGTRMRIIGRLENNLAKGQTPIGSTGYYSIPSTTPDTSIIVSGASGGIGVLLNKDNNSGYYFEIAALTENNILNYEEKGVKDILFYKVYPRGDNSLVPETNKAIPELLWSGYAGIVVDDGSMIGGSRIIAEEVTTVYDLAVEYIDIGSVRRFYLYLNDNLVATVTDPNPLPQYNNMAMFVRGSSKCMFENLYALTKNYSQNASAELNLPANSIFTENQSLTLNSGLRKYSLSGIIKDTYLTKISASNPSDYTIFYDEFGTIMREAAYFNIKYDLAYPAIYSKISPIGNTVQNYTVSGFLPTSYGAEFLVFNATDSALTLNESEGNYLRIQGVAFTQESNNEMTVDKYFNKVSDLSDPPLSFGSIIVSPIKKQKEFNEIKNSRLVHGRKEFNIDSPYIQSQETAESMIGWIVEKIMKPRISVGIRIFFNPAIQLGDIVSIKHKSTDNNDATYNDSRFVVYDIEHSKSSDGPSTTLYLSEVV